MPAPTATNPAPTQAPSQAAHPLPAPVARGPGPTISLVTMDPPETAQVRSWRPVAESWPACAGQPRLQIVPLERACESPADLLGSAVLAAVDDHRDPAAVFKLVDHLWELGVPGVLVFPQLDARRIRLGGKGILVMDEHTPPMVVAATLNALAERQAAIEGLQAELRTARRFHGGLRGEIDKIHDELQLAALVQREFLPRELPQGGGLELQVFFRPAGYVSGDIYDVQRLDEHRIGFFVADAVGHGVPAALMTMVLTRSLTTRVTLAGQTTLLAPAEVLARLNRDMVHRHEETPRFATAVYGIIDTRDRTVTVAGAGHPSPLLISPADHQPGRAGEDCPGVQKIETGGGLLGVFPDENYEQVTFTLGPQDTLVIYSDGFETAFPAPGADEYGRRVPTKHFVDHFAEVARSRRELGLAASVRNLARSLDGQAGSLHQLDDLTALVIAPADAETDLDRLFRGEKPASAE
ncbi:MAG: SpoIIE family protein phosphatase [Phycisphaerales bacterium]|nr:SpoIIE family protein phosphatase [Phycisphaerales bacterium]